VTSWISPFLCQASTWKLYPNLKIYSNTRCLEPYKENIFSHLKFRFL
jgi:hypothetical protein